MAECEHENWGPAREGETQIGCNFNDEGDITFDIVCEGCGLVGAAQIFAATLVNQFNELWWPKNTEDAERVAIEEGEEAAR